jgi:nicotinamide-nucleotide amidase
MTHQAEIISIGDELTSGQRLDTNSRWLSEQLGLLGVKTAFHTTVGDSLDDNIDAFRTAARRADIVIASGGLGPTADDLTREAVAQAFGVELEIREEALQHIESLFAMRKRPMPERNRSQAMFPVGARIVDNPHGTAPGIDFCPSLDLYPEGRPSRIFALPGVPAEMMQMFSAVVRPRLMQEMGIGKKRWMFHSLKVFGIGESDVEKLLPDLIARDRDPVVGITVSKATITLRIAALCMDEAEFRTKIQPTVDEIHAQLGLLVFGEGEIDLQDAINELLKNKEKTLGLIEIGSGAWIQQCLAPLSESRSSGLLFSNWLPAIESLASFIPSGFEATRNDLPESWVNDDVVKLANAAEIIRRHHDLDLCLAAGVYPAKSEIQAAQSLPACDISFALARRDQSVIHTRTTLGAHPDVLYHRLAKAGLNFLRLEMLRNG